MRPRPLVFLLVLCGAGALGCRNHGTEKRDQPTVVAEHRGAANQGIATGSVEIKKDTGAEAAERTELEGSGTFAPTPDLRAPGRSLATSTQSDGVAARVASRPIGSLLGPGKKLRPPPKQGDLTSEVEGCLATPSPSAADGAAFPPAPGAERFHVDGTGGGIILEHSLTHACCRRAEVSSKEDGNYLTVTEHLVGTPCACRCASTVRTAVGLLRGTYHVTLEVEEGGEVRTAGEKDVVVP